ncbi:hypothetical protein [Aestuariirhabdus sp. LZHN29]|uniref:hypothetical protein n=1 Tax=Aestuariirhabdus sp. LZHN29 TaxID=3417462 RepID=UPI003CEC9A65
MPDVKLTREICTKLHEAPDDIKARAEDLQHNAKLEKHNIKGTEAERSGYQEPGLWKEWRVE